MKMDPMDLKQAAKQSMQSAQTLLERAQQQHVTLAVTGLSRSGKTAFITSFINQLMQGNSAQQLPLFDLVRERRLLSVKQVEQPHLNVATFRYLAGLKRLALPRPEWPQATQSLSEIRLQIDYSPRQDAWLWRRSSKKLLLDIIDYPGEWLLDLPLLRLNFQEWSEQQWQLLEQEPRAKLSLSWCNRVIELSGCELDDESVHELANNYADLLRHFKHELGLSQLQPGRMLMPGDLSGTPALAFFPLPKQKLLDDTESNELYLLLESRYQYYVKHIVTDFYRNYFSRFDRQIVLVDCLTPLNQGESHFVEMQRTLAQVMESFHYGEQGWLGKLFQPKIERLLIAATKADHVTKEQFSNVTQLVKELVRDGTRFAEEQSIKTEAMALASIRATRFGYIQQQGKETPALKGNRLLDGQAITVFPGEVPASLPSADYFQRYGFQFLEFSPMPRESDFAPLPHIGMDKAMQFLLGDRLK